MTMITRRAWLLAASLVSPVLGRAETALPRLRIGQEGWGVASPEQVGVVLQAVMAELWRFFPQRAIEPLVVLRGHAGPITQYKRNALGEIVILIDTEDRRWCQFVYQFAHEFCHVLCGFDEDARQNLWFEECLCETASLFVLRRLAKRWAQRAPYAEWRAYSPQFTAYADDLISNWLAIAERRLPQWLEDHRPRMARDPARRDLNGTIALALLPMLESNPQDWRAVTWLNVAPSAASETFPEYLAKWHRATPPAHQPFIRAVAAKLGYRILDERRP
jgi:hypothetical protein